jgi:saccharopine dehydrogenase-like NADP-dependent oxidoreductase
MPPAPETPASPGPVLIAGGYGVVGGAAARALRRRYPDLPLLLAGRTPARGAALAEELGNAGAVAMDLAASPDPLAGLPVRPAAILAAVNDPTDRLLAAAIAQGVPLVDITRWTALVHRALARCAATPPAAPVLLASGWMAGVAPLLAAWAARGVGAVEEVGVAIRYAMADRAGPDSFEYVDRFAERYEATVSGVQALVPGLSDPREATFADGARTRVYRLDTPEQFTLPATLGARTAATRIGFDSAVATRGLVALRRSGILRALGHQRLDGVRRALLHQPGAGGAAELRIDVRGSEGARTVFVSDPTGQAHLTAAGATVAVERLLGLDGGPPEPAGVRFPEQHPDLDAALAALRAGGVRVQAE